MNSNEFKILWQNFKAWIENNHSVFKGVLNDGAVEEEFNLAEKIMNIDLPESFKMIYRIHDGQSINYSGVFPNGILLPLSQIVSYWRNWKELEDQNVFSDLKSESSLEVKPVWWDNKWIPIIYDESGNFYCIDLNPTPIGKMGQIICFWRDSPERKIISSSYAEWFKQNVHDMISGKYVYNYYTGRFELVEK